VLPGALYHTYPSASKEFRWQFLFQQNNLIGTQGVEGIAQTLRERLARWMDGADDPLRKGPVPLPKWAKATNPDAFLPEEQPLIIGE